MSQLLESGGTDESQVPVTRAEAEAEAEAEANMQTTDGDTTENLVERLRAQRPTCKLPVEILLRIFNFFLFKFFPALKPRFLLRSNK